MANEKISDEVAIRLAAMDYAEGWYEGDASRMERCLHHELVKRAIKRNPNTGEKYLNHLTKDDMIRLTKAGGGRDVPRELIYYKVDIMEVYNEVSFVRAESCYFIDYLQLVKDEGKWLILNDLYTTNRANTKSE